MGVIVDGNVEEVSGLIIRSWLDPNGLRLTTPDREPRSETEWIHAIVLHTTRGIPGGADQRRQKILTGPIPHPEHDHKIDVVSGWAEDGICASAHFVIDFDGSIACVADVMRETTYHAGVRAVNHQSIGIEICQGSDAELYEVQLDSAVRLVDYLTRRFGIQRQFHWPYRNQAVRRIAEGGSSVVGVYGHREASDDRGQGDPGDEVFLRLRSAGYESFDLDKLEDLTVWKERQQQLATQLGIALDIDGVPGMQTHAALRMAGHPYGLWIARPGD
ncbi:MAG: peptidoglycan recognition family protein [Polyangia bacterium]